MSDSAEKSLVALISSGKAMISVVSPPFIRSEVCRREVEGFWNVAGHSGAVAARIRPQASNRFRVDMMKSHDKRVRMNDSVVTVRGQVSVPASLRRSMGLRPGHKLHWEQVSEREIRVTLPAENPQGPLAMLGYARRIRTTPPRRTADWMRELREGE